MNMKRTNYFKLLSLFVVMYAVVVAGGCSSIDGEPENQQISETISSIPYSDIIGSWTIESITDSETGKVTPINLNIKVNLFSPIQESTNVATENGYQYWAEAYDDLISYSNSIEEEFSVGIVGFCKGNNENLQSSLVYSFSFGVTIEKEDSYDAYSFSLSDFVLSGKVLKAKHSSYIFGSGTNISTVSGTITMKKQ